MHRDIVVMGASAGGVEARSQVVAGLPDDLDAAVFAVLHLPATATSALPLVLQNRTTLPTASPADGEAVRAGHIYVAPLDHHMLLQDGRVKLDRGPKESGHRPSVDTLFRSAARTHDSRVVGVILSGSLDDGAMGLRLIATMGGAAVVQAPDDAPFPGMPASALEAVPDAIVAPAGSIGEIIGEIVRSRTDPEGKGAVPHEPQLPEVSPIPDPTHTAHEGSPSVFTCPECHGTLFVEQEADYERFKCRVGHSFSADSLLAGQSGSLEAALWAALRALDERNDLTRRLADRARKLGQHQAAARFDERVRDGARNVRLIRQVLLGGETERDSAS